MVKRMHVSLYVKKCFVDCWHILHKSLVFVNILVFSCDDGRVASNHRIHRKAVITTRSMDDEMGESPGAVISALAYIKRHYEQKDSFLLCGSIFTTENGSLLKDR